MNFCKKCKKCGEVKPRLQFSLTLSRQRGVYCKKCAKNSNYHKEKLRRSTDIQYRLTVNLRSRVYKAAKQGRDGSAIQHLGCTVSELKGHIESQFRPGMTWSNWSLHGWHLDHIVPLSLFDLSNRKQFAAANWYLNLQPLWAEDNLIKSNSLPPPSAFLLILRNFNKKVQKLLHL